MNDASQPRTNYMQSLRAYLRTTPWPLLSFAAAFGLVDLIFLPIAGSINSPYNLAIVLLYGLLGTIASQFAALGMWWSWSRSEVLWRTLTSVPLLLVFAVLWLTGEELRKLSTGGWIIQIDHQVLFLAAHISYGLAAASIPLWIMRKAFGWGILPTVSEENHGFTRQISIRDIMVATVIVAVLAALARQLMAMSFDPLPEVLIFSAFAGIVSTITLLPLAFWMLHEKMRVTGIAWAMIFSGLIPFLPLMIIASLSPSGAFMPVEAVFALFVVCYAYCGSVVLILYACRRAGYRLITAWDKLPSAEIVILAVKEEPVHEREITFVDD